MSSFQQNNYEACKEINTAYPQEKEKLIELVPEEAQVLNLNKLSHIYSNS